MEEVDQASRRTASYAADAQASRTSLYGRRSSMDPGSNYGSHDHFAAEQRYASGLTPAIRVGGINEASIEPDDISVLVRPVAQEKDGSPLRPF